jgi:hypothetical protein
MNATYALATAFLKGRVLTIKTAFTEFGVTNLPRECGRLIERKFGVHLARVKREGKSKYGVPCYWYEYRLPNTPYNLEGRQKMIEYLKNHATSEMDARTDKELSF